MARNFCASLIPVTRAILTALLWAAVLSSADASAQINLCTAVANATTVDITGPNGACKRVTNNSGQIACAMTGSIAAWEEFYSKGMPGLTIANCPSACGGYSYGGYCYYLASTDQGVSPSCDTACASRGGCNLAGTQAIGSAGSNAACDAVMNALNDVMVANYGAGAHAAALSGSAAGCSAHMQFVWNVGNSGGRTRYTNATTCAATNPNAGGGAGAAPYVGSQRACACNN